MRLGGREKRHGEIRNGKTPSNRTELEGATRPLCQVNGFAHK